MLSTIQKRAYAWFGVFASKHANEKLRKDLSSAHISIPAEAYMA